MKKLQLIAVAVAIAFITASCHHGSVTVITSQSNQVKTRLEYSGRIIFNDTQNDILITSRWGYFKYERNGEKLNAERDRNGHIVYEVNDADKSPELNEDGRRLLAEAIKEIEKVQHKHVLQVN